MPRIIDLTETDDRPELLTSTSLSGRILGGSKFLSTDPLETYLSEREEPKYGLRNKRSGVTIERRDETEYARPDANLQAVALVTDVRVLFVVGQRSGDETVEIPLSEIVEAKTESGRFRTNTLVVNTVADERWQFACKGDVGPVSSKVDELAQLWTHAQRLLDEAETQVSGAESALTDSDIERARDELGNAERKIQRGIDQIADAGPAAVARVESRAEGVWDRLVDVKRELNAEEGARAHSDAQENWGEQAYEAAARKYECAIEAYETALSTEGPSPTEESLDKRLTGAIRERELLRIGPLVDADSARRRAIEEHDPEEAAEWWERALDGYRELLSLDWGRETREFVVDRDKIRNQTVSIADDAIEDHLRAGHQWVQSADRLAVDGHHEQAREVYDRALAQFENAEQIANEVRPEQLDDIGEALALVENRLSGDTPDELPEDPALESVIITGLDDDSTDDGTPAESGRDQHDEDPTETRAGQTIRSDQQSSQSARTAETPEGEQGKGDTPEHSVGHATAVSGGGQDTESSNPKKRSERAESGEPTTGELSEAEQSTTVPGGPNGESETVELEDSTASGATESPVDEAEPSLIDQLRSQKQTANPEGQSHDTENTEGGADGTGESTDSTVEIDAQLRGLPDEQFERLVSELWESQGWSTTVISVDAKSTFDIVALREVPTEERLGLWILHRPESEVRSEDVMDCVHTREESRGATSATIVTTGEVTESARTTAVEHDIAIVDSAELEQLLRFEEMTDRLASFDQ